MADMAKPDATSTIPNNIGSNGIVVFFCIVLCSVQASLLAWGARVHSPTLNEPGQLVAGLSKWQTGKFVVYSVNTPLAQMVAAIPVLIMGAITDWQKLNDHTGNRIEFSLGEHFIASNAGRVVWLFTVARWACIPFSLFGGFMCFCWARELYGIRGGLLALTLWCFCPNILAHGQIITSDLPSASFGLAAGYAFWRWLKNPTWRRTLISGLGLGIAELTKMTLIVFFPLWITIWLVYRCAEWKDISWQKWTAECGKLAVGMIVALDVLNLGYGFDESFARLGDFRFVSTALSGTKLEGGNRFVGTILDRVPVPLPKDYVMGLDLQKRDFEQYNQPSYLCGEFRQNGWWYYYIYALGIKVPLGTWLLTLLAVTRRIWGQRTMRLFCNNSRTSERGRKLQSIGWRDEFVLLCPAITILFFVSSQTDFNEHMRYVLPIFPFIFVWIGRISPAISRKNRVMIGVAFLALAWSTFSSLSVYPHSLSYFNELVGGPSGGPGYLIHSNIDWGQDLFFLKRWLHNHPEARPIKLAYFGCFDPSYAGIEYSAPENIPSEANVASGEKKIAPGWYAISVNFVRGLPYFTYKGNGSKISLKQYALSAFQRLKPVAMAGYSIYIYHVTD
jgi:hypothetical protein